jgi:cytochrome c-type biogenesis protein CcmH
MEGKPPSDGENKHSLQEIIQGMQYQLQQNPEQPEGWFTLGVAYVQAEMLAPAMTAFERAWRLKPEETRYALTFAQARIFSNQGQLDDLSRSLLSSIVQREPAHEGALLLLGLGAWRSEEYALAVPVLEQLIQVRQQREPNDTSVAMQEVAKALADARTRLQAGPVTRSARLTVTVQVDKGVSERFAPDDVVYIFARALKGPPMPLAVVKRKASELPITVELDDATSMLPDQPLSSVQEIVIEARISRHGSPEKRTGDIEAVAVPVRQGADSQKVALRLNSVIP